MAILLVVILQQTKNKGLGVDTYNLNSLATTNIDEESQTQLLYGISPKYCIL